VQNQHGIDFLKHEKEQRKVRGDDPETTLFTNLHDVYVGLSGQTGISNDGPLHRFANTCTKLIDESIILPAPVVEESAKAASNTTSIFPLEPDPKACCVRCGAVIPGYGAHRDGGRRRTVGSIGGKATVIRAI
jgi:hypothetical protein